MIVPQYWAEARLQHRAKRGQITVRRFGWSDESQAAAQAHAEARTREALDRLIAGEALPRRELRHAYHGAEGTPIREEVVARHDAQVITRNSYGALCLNTPDVLFADIDFEDFTPPSWLRRGLLYLLLVAALAWGWLRQSWGQGALAVIAAIVVTALLSHLAYGLYLRSRGGRDGHARRLVEAFVRAHPDWRLRRYRTPAGLRLLAMHRRFDPREPAVAACFEALAVDPIFARMCQRQHCFRARVSPKPWRIGIREHIRPRVGVWPVAEERLPARRRWIEDYERVAGGYAACRFEGEHGSGPIDAQVDEVRRLHDELCQAESGRPIA